MSTKVEGVAALICLLCVCTIIPGGMVFAAKEKQAQQLRVSTLPENLGSYEPNHHMERNERTTPVRLKGGIPKQMANVNTWCIAKPSTPQEKLDQIINYCCTQPNVDCKPIQAGGMCYLPPNKISDASVVMNVYYNLHGKQPFDCNFVGSGLVITEDPSVGQCIYQA